MRLKTLAVAVLCTFALAALSPRDAKADGGIITAATVGFIGGAIVGAHASPYYYGPYGYAPAYYHAVPSYHGPTYAYSAPYYVASPCWNRRQPVYDRYGGVLAVRYETACR